MQTIEAEIRLGYVYKNLLQDLDKSQRIYAKTSETLDYKIEQINRDPSGKKGEQEDRVAIEILNNFAMHELEDIASKKRAASKPSAIPQPQSLQSQQSSTATSMGRT